MFEYISKGSAILMSILTGIRLVGDELAGTWLDGFFRFLGLGVIIDFVVQFYAWMMVGLIVIFLSRWIKDWRWLFVIGIALAIFLMFLV